ncbi:uncharacterized protein FA14DRAFT_89200 [Meira miltonrushii]|uniref:RTA1-domain-containing protein n=1 Tax=Meira miltonrushii TaxID=1280837 RepID=A0A316V265_9BASI|nr:uncharacterized protein FA14DRAFT_89200 [Meira miltonrushii]PWN31552.1 hypothetical protein FA14DRAFT_89200 [Meira miltonrushii]
MADRSVKAPGVPLDSILYYMPSFGGNIVIGTLFEVVAIFIFINLILRRDLWGLCLPIGALCQGLGFFLRVPLRNNPGSLGLYIVMDFFVVLSPACYFAFNYIWFGRLVQRIEEHMNFNLNRKHITFLPPKKFGKIFIISDVTTFFIQAAGGGLQASPSSKSLGSVIFLIGIIAQFASYIFFLILSLPFVRSLRGNSFDNYARQRISQLLPVLYFSSFWIIVRCVYRTVELAQGYGGYLSRNEAWLFGLDAAPLLLSIGVYIFAWPSAFVELKTSPYAKSKSVPWEMGSKSVQLQWNENTRLNSTDSEQGFTYPMQQKDQDEKTNFIQ